jgi:hypothetical protein
MNGSANAPPASESASAGGAAALDLSWDLYALLSEAGGAPPLSARSTDKELRTAHLKKTKRLHPDKTPGQTSRSVSASLGCRHESNIRR